VRFRRIYHWLRYGVPLRVDGDLRRSGTGSLQEWGEGRWHYVPEPPAPSGSYIELPQQARARRAAQARRDEES
jgi:hypothetical protein